MIETVVALIMFVGAEIKEHLHVDGSIRYSITSLAIGKLIKVFL
jgi:hypothetical protein